jgi:predicted PhzF superfamily epimerase YddE/YHI9
VSGEPFAHPDSLFSFVGVAMILFQIDAFSDQPFSGNPAGVCLLDGPRPDAWMQSLAMEMNLSETAFLLPEAGETGEVWPYFWQLRWFTPTVEVELCGHATLASTHALHAAGLLPEGQTAHFHTRSGLLTAAWRAGWIELNFPARPCQPAAAPEGRWRCRPSIKIIWWKWLRKPRCAPCSRISGACCGCPSAM